MYAVNRAASFVREIRTRKPDSASCCFVNKQHRRRATGDFIIWTQIKFCLNARGSLEELLDDLNICADESYLPPADIADLKKQAGEFTASSMVTCAGCGSRKQGAALTLREDSPAYGRPMINSMRSDEFEPPALTLQRFNLNEAHRHVS